MVYVNLDGVLRKPNGEMIPGADRFMAELCRDLEVCVLTDQTNTDAEKSWLDSHGIQYHDVDAVTTGYPTAFVGANAVTCDPAADRDGMEFPNAARRCRELAR